MTKKSNVVSLAKARKQVRNQKSQHHTMCKNGIHKWLPDKDTQFDTKLGKLVTRYVCKYCGAFKVKGD